MGIFHMDVRDLYWLADPGHEQEDLCLHGFVTAIIGDEVFQSDGTVSSTALYLLKTLTQNHIAGKENQMIPCCGHTLIANEDLSEVYICGCPNGMDWTAEQAAGGVKITTESGRETFVPAEEYKAEVFRFADKVENFYASCNPKQPYDDFSGKGYTAFWNEWHRRRRELDPEKI